MPAIKRAGWDDMTQIRQEVKLRDGKVVVRGMVAARKKVKSADIVLYHKPSMPLAVIEAKANKHEVGKGMQQGPPSYSMSPSFLPAMVTVLFFMTKRTLSSLKPKLV